MAAPETQLAGLVPQHLQPAKPMIAAALEPLVVL